MVVGGGCGWWRWGWEGVVGGGGVVGVGWGGGGGGGVGGCPDPVPLSPDGSGRLREGNPPASAVPPALRVSVTSNITCLYLQICYHTLYSVHA